jgi:nitroreductase
MVNGKEMLELIKNRQSDRSYSNKGVEKEKIERIIEAGRMAPSACNALSEQVQCSPDSFYSFPEIVIGCCV